MRTAKSKINVIAMQRNLFEYSAGRKKRTFIELVNIFLIAIVLVSIAGYAFLSNNVVAQEYVASVKKNKVGQLGLIKSNLDSYNTSEIADYARRAGMVEAKVIETLYDRNGFAYSDSLNN
ncbi:MAG: hypothetical protein CEN90_157 [Parcubacteria group bacterium Licking1014_17]|nr:MAG: hypothetical protein CEN90_157 [Parcubacteria group bacterium Licking1014_17]